MYMYSVGEKVKIVANTCYHGFENGTIVKIKEVIDAGDCCYYEADGVSIRNSNITWCVTNADLEKLK